MPPALKSRPTGSTRAGRISSRVSVPGSTSDVFDVPMFPLGQMQAHMGGMVTEYTSANLSTGNLAISGTSFVANVSESLLLDSIAQLTAEMERLRSAVELMSKRIDIVSAKFDSYQSLPRSVSDEDGKAEIKKYFDDHHGETIYPSDVAEELNISYETVTRLISELEQDGRVSKV